MKQSVRFFIVFFACLIFTPVQAAVKGSQTAVSVEANFIFPAIDSDNKLEAFGWFKNGFSLEDNSTTCTFDSVYPVSGTVDLNGGTLYLSQDLIFKNITTLQGLGTIVANDHVVDFCSSITYLSDAATFEDVKLHFNIDTVINSTVTFKGDSVVCGNGHALTLDTNGVLVFESGANIELCDLEIEGLSAGKLICLNDTAKITLNDVVVHLDADYSFTHGSLYLVDNVSFVGTATFEYDSGQTSTLASQAHVIMGEGITLRMGRKEATNFVEPLYFEDSSSELTFDNASWLVTATGFQFTRGTILFSRDVTLEVLGTTTDAGIIIGDGIADNDATVHYLPGVSLVHKAGYLTYNNTVPDKLISSSKESRLIRYNDSHIYVAQDVVVPPITIELATAFVPPLEVAEYKTLDYQDSRVVIPGIALDITSNQLNAYTYYLNGGDSIFLTKGSLPLNLLIGGTGNVLRGNGNLDGTITFEDSDADLTIDLQGMLANTVYLNGGTINLDRDLSLELATTFSQGGKVNLGGYKIEMGETSIAWGAPMLWEGASGKVQFHGRFSLASTWTFSGYCVLVGDEASFEFLDDGEIVVEDDSTLVIKSTRILGLKDQKVRCLGSNSKVVFADVETYLIGDYSFDTGSMEFLRKNSFLGAYTFSYESNQTSTIDAYAEWHIGDRAKLSIGRKEATDFVEPLAFVDNTSIWHFDNASLCVTGTGMEFTKGTFLSSRDVDIEVVSTSTMNGFFLGNGVTQDNPVLEMRAGAIVTFTKGAVVYDITALEGFKTQAVGARIVRNAESILHVKQNLQLQNIFISMDPLSVFTQEDYTVFTFNNTTVDQSFGKFKLTGTRLNVFTNILGGNESIFLSSGALPLYTVATGAGNSIKGNGTITGGIVLQDPTAEVDFNLNGFMANDITLAGASMTLSGNLAFVADAEILGVGSVGLAQHTVHLSPVDAIATSTISWSSSGGSIELHGNLLLTSPWVIDGSCTIRGNGNTLTFGDSGSIVASDGATVTFRDIILAQVSGDAIVCASDDSGFVLGETSMILDDNYTFSVGSIEFDNTVSIMGSYTFAYESSQTSTIAHDSNLIFSNNVLFKAGRKNDLTSQEPLAFTDLSSILTFENASFLVTSSGMGMTKGTIVCAKDILIDVVSTTTTYGLHLGDGTEVGDIKVELHPGSAARFNSGAVLINSYSPYPLRSFSQDAKMFRGNTSVIHVVNSTELSDMTFEVSQTAQFTMNQGAIMSCNDCTVLLDKGQFDLTGIRYNWFSNLLNGNHEIFLSKGILNLWTYVSGSNNLIHGNGSVNGNIIFLDSDAQLTWNVNGSLLKDVLINGGTLDLTSDLHMASDVILSGSGTVRLDEYSINYGSRDIVLTSTLRYEGIAGELNLNSNVELSGVWTFSGEHIVNGKGNTLSLDTTGKIIIAEGSHLTLSNITLNNISQDQILCLDDQGLITLEDVHWCQDGSYSFTHGAFEFDGQVKISSNGFNFAYQSNQTSTILSGSILKFDTGTTFSYDPAIPSKHLIEFVDDMSVLVLNGATLHTTVTGLELHKGVMIVKRDSYLSSERADIFDNYELQEDAIDEGISFGSGMLGDDFKCEILSGVSLYVIQGTFEYKNVNASAWLMLNDLSTLHLKNGTQLRLYENLELGKGRVIFEPNTTFARIPAKKIIGSLNTAGDLTITNIDIP